RADLPASLTSRHKPFSRRSSPQTQFKIIKELSWDSMSASYALRASALQAGAGSTVAETDLPQWFAVQTRYRFEKKVAAQLTQKGCKVYLPLRTEQHLWSDRQKAVTVALFPGYAFVQIDSSREARHRVLQTAGLIGFVSFGGTMIPVPAKQLNDLHLLLL